MTAPGGFFLHAKFMFGAGRLACRRSMIASSRTPMSSESYRFLVVDDDADSADSLAMLLCFKGHEARAAYDGEAALEIFREYQPQVVILDLAMPKYDGFAVAGQLRQQPEADGAVLLALTGFADESMARRCLEAGFCERLIKPVDAEGLEKLLARIPAWIEASAWRIARN
jgi:CheY-like chemotaxis protein